MEPTPWGEGITVSVITATYTVACIVCLCLPVVDQQPVLGAGVAFFAAAGIALLLWRHRRQSVSRWIVLGVLPACVLSVGIVIAFAVTRF